MGTYRGGTSFLAEACKELGLWIGDNFVRVVPKDNYISYEDGELGVAIDNKNIERIKELADIRNEQFDKWGFKKPSSVFIIDQILPLFRNPHLIIIVRDALAASQSKEAHGGNIHFTNARMHAGSILDLIDKPRAPTLAISFERAKQQRGKMKQAIKEFLK